jgi:hypothetical protein
MTAFVRKRYGEYSPEAGVVRRYIEALEARAYGAIASHERLAMLYARYDRRQILSTALLRERAAIYEQANPALRGEPNNVRLANYITYARYLPLLESVYARLGEDLPGAVRFFRRVDEIKPSSAVIMQTHGLNSQASVQFLRAYETAVLETIRKATLGEVARRKLD